MSFHQHAVSKIKIFFGFSLGGEESQLHVTDLQLEKYLYNLYYYSLFPPVS